MFCPYDLENEQALTPTADDVSALRRETRNLKTSGCVLSEDEIVARSHDQFHDRPYTRKSWFAIY
jgi:hypothetical protein